MTLEKKIPFYYFFSFLLFRSFVTWQLPGILVSTQNTLPELLLLTKTEIIKNILKINQYQMKNLILFQLSSLSLI